MLPTFSKLDTPLLYETDLEYRVILREFYNMNCDKKVKHLKETEIDEVSLDEMLFDDENVLQVMDEIYKQTSHHVFFKEMYTYAAGLFISWDAQIGVTVLCSFDYFRWFYPCLRDFLDAKRDGKEWNSSKTESAIGLRKVLVKPSKE